MTKETAYSHLLRLLTDKRLNKSDREALRFAIRAFEQQPHRIIEGLESEIEDLHKRLDIAEYDKERLKEKIRVLEEARK